MSRSLVLFLACVLPVAAHQAGAPAGYTGAPGEPTCAACHAGTPNTKGGSVTASFATLLTYTPGIQQQVLVRVVGVISGQPTGFQVTARYGNNQQAGTLSAGARTVVLTQGGFSYAGQNIVSPEGLYYFNWAPPATNVGTVEFYLAAVAAPTYDSPTPDGDVYTAQYSLTPDLRGYPSGFAADFFSIQSFDTQGTAISNDGRTAGTYRSGSQTRGYARNLDGTPVLIDFPGATNTNPLGINSSGTVVGTYDGASGTRGFVRGPDGSYRSFDVPGATATAIVAINDTGQMLGSITSGGTVQGVPVSADLQPGPFLARVPMAINSAGAFTGSGQPPGYDSAVNFPEFYAYVQQPGGYTFAFDTPCRHNISSRIVPPIGLNDFGDTTVNCENSFVGNVSWSSSLRLGDSRVVSLGGFQGLLPVGPYPVSSLGGVNNRREIVGTWQASGSTQAVVLRPCTTTITQTQFSAPSTGATLNIPVSAPANCTWPAATTDNWITPGTTGSGNGTLTVTVAANPSVSPRTGTLDVGGTAVTITEDGSPCTYSLDNSSALLGFWGGTTKVNVTATTGCAWTATSPASWVGFPGGASGNGNGSVTIAAGQNPTTSLRSTTVSIGSQQFILTQVAAPSPAPAGGLRFVPATPCRIADTRNPNGTFGGPALAEGSTRTFPIPQSSCGIPASAQAYSLNVTVVPSGQLGYLTVSPTGQARPTVSTLNSPSGKIVANAAIVPAGTGGAIDVYLAGAATDLVLDINGYFAPVDTPASLAFYPVTPCRIADTRVANGAFGSPSVGGGTARSFAVPQSACNIPATAQAYSLNATVVPQAPLLSFLTLWAAGASQPWVSTLNSPDGSVVANAAIVPAGVNGAISAYATDTADLVLDIDGYFAPPSAGGLSFYTVAPCRIADTRNPAGASGGPILAAGATRAFPIPSSACGIPSTAQAYSLNATVVPSAALHFLTLWPAGAAQPLVSTLNSFNGLIVANAAIVPAGSGGAISAFVTEPAHLVLDTNGYFAP